MVLQKDALPPHPLLAVEAQQAGPTWQSLSLRQWPRRVAIPRIDSGRAPNRPADSDRAEKEIARRARAPHVACPCHSMPQKRPMRNEIFFREVAPGSLAFR